MGLGMPAAAWPDEFCERLAAHGLRVIRFDNRDSGRSSHMAGARRSNVRLAFARALLRLPVRAPYTLDDMANDAAALLTALGVEQAHVVGASMGGMMRRFSRLGTAARAGDVDHVDRSRVAVALASAGRCARSWPATPAWTTTR
jgi:proline iminopeptidase